MPYPRAVRSVQRIVEPGSPNNHAHSFPPIERRAIRGLTKDRMVQSTRKIPKEVQGYVHQLHAPRTVSGVPDRRNRKPNPSSMLVPFHANSSDPRTRSEGRFYPTTVG